MSLLEQIKKEMTNAPDGEFFPDYFRAIGYRASTCVTPSERRAEGIASLLTMPRPFLYQNDWIAGSILPLFVSLSDQEKESAKEIVAAYPERSFGTNADHYSPDYETVLQVGVGGLIEKIKESEKQYEDDSEKLAFLNSMHLTLLALQSRIRAHADLARKLIGTPGYDPERLTFIARNCERIAESAPETFPQALQLVWMIHTSFLYEGRSAMALGRMDQYLYPFFCHDIASGCLTKETTIELLENTLVKICERRFYLNGDDVVNICIGGVDSENHCAVNDLSYCILHAVKNINLPGPNLSARITSDTPDVFLDECLKSIGTGLGYPALMNDAVNMAALRRFGYEEEDVRNYSMVGCIENFITGMQPPWSDGRFDTPRYLEYLLLAKGSCSPSLDGITSMELFMHHLEEQLALGAKDYMYHFNHWNVISDAKEYTSPFLSCFCRDCIARGRDINMGGAKYPSVHGVALMGIGTMSDSLAAIEKVVFCDKEATLAELAEAMKNNFVGHEELREKLLAAPKYGNNDSFVDKYAVWFSNYLSGLFDQYRTYDGGGIYTLIAANISNIYAGNAIGATPDGRLAGKPLSDAASPTYGCDTKGATSTLLSVSKPNYTLCGGGSVVNQKYSPTMFEDGKRAKLLSLIRVYFANGGQEIQINATSTETLRDAMEHPEKYPTLVVRVSGFSALYVTLSKEVQEDILQRTQQG